MTNYNEYIYAIYQEKSFSKAAKKLFVSQPWLSATIKKAEQEIGLPVFDRSTNPISLTPAGQYYIEQMERIMAIEQEMQAHLKELRDTNRTELHIGSSMFFCTYVLPSLMEDFRAQYPQVTVTFIEGSNRMLLDKLLNGQLDVILEAEQPASNQLQSIPWASEEIVLAVPASNPVNKKLERYGYSFEDYLTRTQENNRRPAVPLEAFANENFILLKNENDIYKRSLKLCQNAGFTPSISLYLTQMMTAYYLVLEGQGITFLRSTIPEHVASTDRVVFYQLDDPLAVRSIYLSYGKHKATPIQKQLIDFMKQKVF